MDQINKFIKAYCLPKNISKAEKLANTITKKMSQTIFANFLEENHQILHKNVITYKKVEEMRVHIANLNNEIINDQISEFLGLIYGKYTLPNPMETNYQKIVKEIDQNGYHKASFAMTQEWCDNVIEAVSNLKFIGKVDGAIQIGIDYQTNDSSTVWVKDQADVVNIKEIQELITNPDILNIAQGYLRSIPILAQTNMWYSRSNKKGDQTQQFHQDYDDIKFLKVFIYLNDVDNQNGPHTYIKGSRNNKILPKKYKPSQRFNDEWIQKHYKNDVITLPGKKGTILFVDTNGIHRGGDMISGNRALVQLQFTCSTCFFGAKIPVSQVTNITSDLKENLEKYPLIYCKIVIS